MRQRLVAAVVAAVVAASMPSTASASPEDTAVFHLSGQAGSAILTDCVGVPVGGTCRAVDVFAFEQRVNDDGDRLGGPGLDVTLFDVTIVAQPPGFVAVPVGFGFTEDITVQIDRNLSSGSAAAAEVPLGPAGNVAVTVVWEGSGPL